MESEMILNNENVYTEENERGDNSLNLQFSMGYTSNMVGVVHNLTRGESSVITF